jgi:hypothetical protein
MNYPEFLKLKYILLLAWLLCLTFPGFADDYSFDLSEFAQKRLEINYKMDLRPGFSFLNQGSRFYKLTLQSASPRRFQQNHKVLMGAVGSYKAGSNSTYVFDGLLTLNRFMGKTSSNHVLNESYLRFDIDSRLQLAIGKKTLKWGKGYAWNPVNFAGRQKDLNDIDLALTGYNMLFSQYSRTMQGYLSSMTLTMVLLPVSNDINDDFTPNKSLNFASQLYMLLGDTDVDFYLLAGSEGRHKSGVDFSHNLSSNHEIHAELALSYKHEGYKIAADGRVNNIRQRQTSFLLGTRYLDRREITWFLEYFHNGAGLSRSEMNSYLRATDLALASASKPQMRQSAYNFSNFINRQFVMKDYVYFKAAKSELFNDLYINGSVFNVFNLADNSTSTSLEVSYTGQTDQIVTLRYTKNQGKNNSEFGQKLSSDKIELRCQYFF